MQFLFLIIFTQNIKFWKWKIFAKRIYAEILYKLVFKNHSLYLVAPLSLGIAHQKLWLSEIKCNKIYAMLSLCINTLCWNYIFKADKLIKTEKSLEQKKGHQILS